MLSEALTSLEDVKSRLQQSLLLRPEYCALLVVDEATMQLATLLEPFGIFIAPPEDAVEGANDTASETSLTHPDVVAIESYFAHPSAEPAPLVAAVAPREDLADPPIAATEELSDVLEAAPVTPAIFRMAGVLREFAETPPKAAPAGLDDATLDMAPGPYELIDDSLDNLLGESAPAAAPLAEIPAVAAAREPDSEPPMSRMAALYLSIGGAMDDAPPEDRAAEPPKPAHFARPEQPAGMKAPISGVLAASYETIGDAPDPALTEDSALEAEALTEVAQAEDAPVPAASDVERPTAKAAAPPSPAARALAQRNYLPYIAAQKLIQSRRL